MIKNMTLAFWKAVAVLVGTIVGAGIFGLPYVFARAGFWVGIAYLVIVAVVLWFEKTMYAEMVLRTKGEHEMAGFARKYLGVKGEIIMSLSLVLGIYAALVAYIIGAGRFLFEIFGPTFGGSELWYNFLFWIIASIIVWRGIGTVAWFELGMIGVLCVVVFIIFGVSARHIELSNFSLIDTAYLFLPYGVTLFAMGGASAIPTMRRLLIGQEKKMKKAITIGLLIPVVIYLIFIISIVGVTGIDTTEEGVIGLASSLGRHVLIIGGIFGILSMSTSFLALAYVLRQHFHFDFKLPKWIAWAVTIGVPLIIFLLGMKNFIAVIGISGSILGGVQGILLLEAAYRAKKKGERKPEFVIRLPRVFAYAIYIVFIAGILYEFLY